MAHCTSRLAALLIGVALLSAPPAAMSQDEPAPAGAPGASDPAALVEGFEHMLPPDTVAFLGSVDVDAARRNLSATAYGAWWRDEANAPLREALADFAGALGDEAMAASGVDPLELPAMAHGRLALAWTGDFVGAIRADEPQGQALELLADVGADHEACDAIVARLLDKAATDGRMARKLEDIDGTEVTVLEEVRAAGKPWTRLRVAFRGDTLIVLLEFLPVERDLMAFIFGRLAGEPAPCLADEPRFRDSLAAQPGDVQGWIDGAAVVGAIRVELERKSEATPDEPAADDDEDPPIGETFDNLGLSDLGELSLSLSWSGQGSRVQARAGWTGKGWIPSVARCLLGPGDAGLLGSAPGSATGAIGAHIDFGALFEQVIQIGVQSGKLPPSAAVDFLARAHETLGFDLRDDLLEALDGRLSLFVFQVPPEDALPFGSAPFPLNEVIQIGLHDGTELNSLIEGFVRRTGGQAARQRSEVLGYEVFHLPLGPGFTAHYAILPDVAILSFSETLLLDALRRKADPGLPRLAGDSLFRARMQQLELPAGLMHYGVASLGLLVAAQAAEGLRASYVKFMTGEKAGDVAHRLAQRLADLPNIDASALAKYFDGGMLTTLTMDERGLLFQSASP